MEDVTEKLLITKELPHQFIFDLGVYLQTCAHIELTTCSLICSLEDLRSGEDKHRERYLGLRKRPLKDLISDLRGAASALPSNEKEGLLGLIDWIKTYVTYRHMAAHGAFQWLPEVNKLRVHYVHQTKSHGEKLLSPEERLVDRSDVSAMVRDADRILKIVCGLDQRVIAGEVPLHGKG